LGWALTVPVVADGQAPQFRATTELVSVDVSVRDRTRVVTTLQASDFEVLDNGVPQNVLNLSYGTLPIDVTIALDVSLSVDGARFEQLRRAVARLMRDLESDDRLRLVPFNMRVSRAMHFTGDVGVVDQAMRSMAAGGGTSIWDAAAIVLASPPPPDRRHLLVTFTDGADSTSITTPGELIQLAQRANTTVAAVLPAAGFLRPLGGQGPAILRSLAVESGGTVLQMRSAGDDLGATFGRVLDGFRSTYVLHFQPGGVPTTGFHTLDVSVAGKPGYTVKARRGYFR
jgi:VWFA-related protein